MMPGHLLVLHRHGTRGDEAERMRVKFVLGSQDALGQRFGRVSCQNGDGGLRDDWPGIHFQPHEMNRAAVNADAVAQGPLMSVEPRK